MDVVDLRDLILKDFSLVAFTVSLLIIAYLYLKQSRQARIIVKLQAQIDLLVNLIDKTADPNESGAIWTELAQLRQETKREIGR